MKARNELLFSILRANMNASDIELQEECDKRFIPASPTDFAWARKQMAKQGFTNVTPIKKETPEERDVRVAKAFSLYDKTLDLVGQKKFSSLVVSGSAGIGKSYVAEQALPKAVFVRGSMSAIGLYETLYLHRYDLIIFDDCDAFLWDMEALNLLKAVLDTTGTRTVAWAKQNKALEEAGIEREFVFDGQVVFLTNIDFRAEVARGNKVAPNLNAVMDRSFYLQLSTQDHMDTLIRAKQLADIGAWSHDAETIEKVIEFVEDNFSKWSYISLRLIGHIADIAEIDPEGWQDLALALKAS